VNVSIVIATCGSDAWSDLAWSRAYPSADSQEGRGEVVIQHHPDLTVSEARNAAARSACGDVLVFLDADDELAPCYLYALRPLLAPRMIFRPPGGGEPQEVGPGPCLGVPAVSYVYPDGGESPPAIPQKGRWPELNECVIGTAVSRDLFLDVGGFRDLPSLEDYDLFLRCFDAGAGLAYVPDAVYRAHVRPGGRNADQSPYASIWADHLSRIGVE
jgi:glycosyltransferase involved in cell wall biosynthesis